MLRYQNFFDVYEPESEYIDNARLRNFYFIALDNENTRIIAAAAAPRYNVVDKTWNHNLCFIEGPGK